MKVVDLWNKFYSWSPYTVVEVDDSKSSAFYNSLRSEDVLKRYANNEVVEFDYDSKEDKLSLVV